MKKVCWCLDSAFLCLHLFINADANAPPAQPLLVHANSAWELKQKHHHIETIYHYFARALIELNWRGRGSGMDIVLGFWVPSDMIRHGDDNAVIFFSFFHLKYLKNSCWKPYVLSLLLEWIDQVKSAAIVLFIYFVYLFSSDSNPPLSEDMLPPGDWMCHRCNVRKKVSRIFRIFRF